MNNIRKIRWGAGVLLAALMLLSVRGLAQGSASATARMDAARITVGDQARMFIEVQSSPDAERLQWAVIPDTFNRLEIVERGKIDTQKQGSRVVYRQRLVLTGFDSGLFTIPAFQFAVIPNSGTPYMVQTDSFALVVQTVAVDTSKAFKGIKNIIYVNSSWLDNLPLIAGVAVFVLLVVFIVLYFIKHKKLKPPVPERVETLQEHSLRLLAELEQQELWQKNKVKEYYVELTGIVRNYIEQRFNTPALELTTDELLHKVQLHREMQPYYNLLSVVLHTADLAKFAKAEPLPQEHTEAMEKSRMLIKDSAPVLRIQELPAANSSNGNNIEKQGEKV